MTKEEAERFLPRVAGDAFKRELNIVESGAAPEVASDMLDLKGWKVIGWAYTDEVGKGGNWRYVCMFENGGGLRYWNQVPTVLFCRLAELTQEKAANGSRTRI